MISITRRWSGFTSLLVTAAVVLAFGSQAPPPSRAEASGPELVQNGSFEDVVGAPPGTDPSIMEGPVVLPGWTQTSPDNCGTEVWSYGFIVFADTGNRLVELDAACNGILEQTIQTTPGEKYVLSFAFAARPEWNGRRPPFLSNGLDASVDGVVLHIRATDSDGWHHYRYAFTAAGPQTALAFAGAGKNDSLGSLLDSVSVTVRDFEFGPADCENDGWRYIFGDDGQSFKNERVCVKFFSPN